LREKIKDKRVSYQTGSDLFSNPKRAISLPKITSLYFKKTNSS